MRLWADVTNAAGVKQGDGPVLHVTSASVTRRLDGAGTIQLEVPGSDVRAVGLLTNEARVRVYVEQMGAVREIGRGIVRQVTISEGASGERLSVDAIDTLDELKRRTVKYNRRYSNQTVAAVVSDLVSLVPGWLADCGEAATISARFDGISVLKALQTVAELQGLHVRLGDGNTVEVGAFGEANGLTLVRVEGGAGQMLTADVALIESMQISSSSEAVANRISVVGAGANADSAFSLAKCTRTPLIVETVNGRLVYLLEDTDSVARYGVIERDVQIKEIAPLSNTEVDEQRAANALYDAAAAWLRRNSTAVDTYRLVARGVQQTVRPGDKVRVMATGRVEQAGGGGAVYRQIDELLWVLSVTERVNLDGIVVEMDVANADRYEADAARVVIGGLEQIQLQGVAIQPTINHYTYGPEQVQMNSSNPALVQLTVTDACFSIDRVLMRVRTQPFVSTTTAAAAGGNHRHLIATYLGPNTASVPGLWAAHQFAADSAGSGKIFDMPNSSGDIYTYAASGDHTHAVTYGIYKDGSRPASMTITVNGVTVASGVGSSGADFDATYDVTDAIRNKAGGFRTVHDVVVSCASGQGEVLVGFDVYETITPFRFGV